MPYFRSCLAAVFLASQTLAAQPASPPKPAPVMAALPDAPQSASLPRATSPQLPGHSAVPIQPYAPLYARTIFPGEIPRHLNARQKFLYAGRQMVEPINLLPALLSSGWSQYQNSDPKYGTGAAALGQRFGAAIAREDSGRLFTDGLLPVLLHEDPRYYRLGESSSNFSRATHAIGQTFIARTDSGRVVPNYSGFLGRAMDLGLTYAYYPPESRSGGVYLRGFATSIGGLAAFNVLREFVPREVFSHLTIFRQPAPSHPAIP